MTTSDECHPSRREEPMTRLGTSDRHTGVVGADEARTDDAVLRERRDALDLVASETVRARAGAGGLTLIRGATGTGRSALLEAVADLGAAQGMRVLRAHCSAEDTGTPFATVLRLLCRRPGSHPDAPSGPAGPVRDPLLTVGQQGTAARLWQLLCSQAAAHPLLLIVDDVHLADRPSRSWLAEAARRIDRLPLLIVASERSQYDIAPPTPGLAHALSPTLVRVHTLAPLSRDAARDLVRDRFGRHVPDTWVDDCVRAGAGSPLLLRALLHDLGSPAASPAAWNGAPADAPDGAATGALPDSCAALYPGAFAAAVAWWLDSAGPGTAAVARTLAELEDGDDAAELLAGVAGADPARVAGWVTAMVRLGVLRHDPVSGGPRFAHPLLRDAVLDGWPRAHRQAAHHAAAVLRHRRGDPAEAVAAHLLKAAPVGTAWAADALLDAVPTAVRADRPEDALAYLRRALDEPMPRERRAAALTELGVLEFATAARSTGIPRLTEALRLQDLPRDRVQAAVTLGTALAHRGEAHAAFAVLHDLDLDLGPDGGPAGDPVLARTVRTASALLSDHDREIRREVYTRLRDTAAQSPALIGPAEQALLVRYEATAGLVSAEQAMRRVHALLEAPEDPLLTPYLLGTAAAVAQWADALDDAERLVTSGLAERRLSPLHPMRRALLNVRTDIAVARGQYARVLAGPGHQDLPADRAAPAGPSNLQAQTLLALVESGRLPEAERFAGSVLLRDAHDNWELHRYLFARGLLRTASGDAAGALEDFLECGRRQTAREVLSPVVTPWRSAAAECLLALGRPQAALPLAEEEYRLATVWNTPRVLGRALRVLGAATGGRRGLDLTAGAVDLLRGAGLDTELVAALIARGRQLTAAGHSGQARPLLHEAAASAERLGAARLLTDAELALRDGGGRRRDTPLTGADALTGSEDRIARLAADGSTNAEIADLLHLARRTVETHLTSTYRKLGIRGRADLRAALGD
ncbi:AAA family ATPase [Streptacidiphilus sp. EB129]|uniref:AAA family ATPase n=1 Tax=Streptacidiphilus sp. EB129 TaxID=3156262 RepID=UPI0035197568